MANTELIISEIKTKANRLKAEVGALRQRVAALESDLAFFNSKTAKTEDTTHTSESNISNNKPAITKVGKEEERGEMKLKINEIIKEVDRCIALLNK